MFFGSFVIHESFISACCDYLHAFFLQWGACLIICSYNLTCILWQNVFCSIVCRSCWTVVFVWHYMKEPSNVWLHGYWDVLTGLTSLKTPAWLFTELFQADGTYVHEFLGCLLSCPSLTLLRSPVQLLMSYPRLTSFTWPLSLSVELSQIIELSHPNVMWLYPGCLFSCLKLTWLKSAAQLLTELPQSEVSNKIKLAWLKSAAQLFTELRIPVMKSLTRPRWLSVELSQAGLTQITCTAVYWATPIWGHSQDHLGCLLSCLKMTLLELSARLYSELFSELPQPSDTWLPWLSVELSQNNFTQVTNMAVYWVIPT